MRRGGWVVVATGVLVASLVAAAVTLPARVDVYLGPAHEPDVAYARWVYLTVFAVAAPVVAVAQVLIVRSLLPIARTFGLPLRGPVSELVAVWTLLWSAGVLLLVVTLGNDHPEVRSTLEFLSGVPLLLGSALIVALCLRRSARR